MGIVSERIMLNFVEEANVIEQETEDTIDEGEILTPEVSKEPVLLLERTIAINSVVVGTPSMRNIRHMVQGAI